MRFPVLTVLCGLLGVCLAAGPEQCVPARWTSALNLDWLQGTPINCLVVDGDNPEVAAGAGRRGITVLALDRLLTAAAPVVVVSDSLWPRVEARSGSAGPTGDPWIDSNPWRVRSLRAAHRGRPVWLAHRPKQPKPQEYLRAIADAAMGGGQWIVSVEEQLPEEVWRQILLYLRFYQDHADWKSFVPRARLAVVQDPAARNRAISGENLNLLSRRQMPFRVIHRPDLSAASLAGIDTVIATDLDPPSDAEKSLLDGRLVFYKQTADPFAFSLEVLNRMGRAGQGVRLFNASSIISYLSQDPSGRQVLLQLVNYADGPLERVTARLQGDFRTARLYSPEEPPADLPLEKAAGGVEITIPTVKITAAVLLE